MIHDYDQAKPITYNVRVVIKAPLRGDQIFNWTLVQEDLDKVIGRYTRKHGPPINMSDKKNGPCILDFYSKTEQGTWDISLTYEQAKPFVVYGPNEGNGFQTTVERRAATPPPPPIVHPEQMKAMIDAEVITGVNKWGY